MEGVGAGGSGAGDSGHPEPAHVPREHAAFVKYTDTNTITQITKNARRPTPSFEPESGILFYTNKII
jgi:hypothetical protein